MNQELEIRKWLVVIALNLITVGIFLFGSANNASAAGGVVINEIFFNPSGSDTGKEFIELYNQDSIGYDLKNWSLKLSDGTSLAKVGSNASDQTTILANGYLLVGLNNYDQAPTADVKRSAALPNSAKTVQLFNDLNSAIDSASYDTSVSEGQSWTRSGPQIPAPQNSGLTASASANTNSSANTNTANSNSSTNSSINTNSTSPSANSSPILSNIIFNEAYPNPPDESTEFIELKNASGFAGSPAGWKIKDASGDEYNLSDKEIADGALWIIPKLESGISLNNDSETLTLVNPNSAAFATLAIPSAPESQSYARSGVESFEWTATLTAGAENIFTQTVSAPAEIAAPVNANSSASNTNASNSNSSVNANANTNANAGANTNSPKTATDFSAIKLSELMPNPAGDDADGEWIELYNGGDKEIDLAALSLSDASGKIYAIPKNTIISAKSYKVFYRKQTGIVLNNDQDAIDLKDSSGKKIDNVSYIDGGDGKSYSRTNSGWQWSSPTPEKANSQSVETNSNVNGNTNSSAIKRIGSTINEAKNSKARSIITVSGIVTAALGEISKNTFYIQDETGGIAVVLESGALEISRGDFAVIKGKIKTSSGEKILSAENEKQITVQSSGNNSAAWQMNIADIDSQSLGLFIGVSGKAVQLNDNGLVIDDGSGSLAILLPAGTNAEKDQMVSVQGILKKTKDGIVLVLRDKNDFISGNVLGESDQKNLSIAGNGKKYDIIIQLLIIIVTLLIGGYAARKYLQKYSYATSDTKPAEESKEDRDSNSGFGI